MYKLTVTPRFGDADGLRHVNNNVLGAWFELGRNDIFKFFSPELKLDYEHWKLIMVHTDYDFLAQIYLNSDVEIRTYILKVGNSSFTVGHEAWQDGVLKAKGRAIIVHFDFIEQESKRIPDDIRAKLEEHLMSEEDIGKN